MMHNAKTGKNDWRDTWCAKNVLKEMPIFNAVRKRDYSSVMHTATKCFVSLGGSFVGMNYLHTDNEHAASTLEWPELAGMIIGGVAAKVAFNITYTAGKIAYQYCKNNNQAKALLFNQQCKCKRGASKQETVIYQGELQHLQISTFVDLDNQFSEHIVEPDKKIVP